MRRLLAFMAVLPVLAASLTMTPQASAVTVSPTVTLDVGSPTAYAHEKRTVTATISHSACQDLRLERFDQGAWRYEDDNYACEEPDGDAETVEFTIYAPERAGSVDFRVVAKEGTDYSGDDPVTVSGAVSQTATIDYQLDPSTITGWPSVGPDIRVGQMPAPVPVEVTWSDWRDVLLQRKVGDRWRTKETYWPDYDDVAQFVVQFPLATRAGSQAWRLVMPQNEAGRGVVTPTMTVSVARARTTLDLVRTPRRAITYIGATAAAVVTPGYRRRVYLQQFNPATRRWANVDSSRAYGRRDRVLLDLPGLRTPGRLKFRVLTRRDAVGTRRLTTSFVVRYVH